MATFTNVSGEDRHVPVYDLFVAAGADFDIPDADVDGLRAQVWCTEKISKKTETVTAPVDAEQGVN